MHVIVNPAIIPPTTKGWGPDHTGKIFRVDPKEDICAVWWHFDDGDSTGLDMKFEHLLIDESWTRDEMVQKLLSEKEIKKM